MLRTCAKRTSREGIVAIDIMRVTSTYSPSKTPPTIVGVVFPFEKANTSRAGASKSAANAIPTSPLISGIAPFKPF